MSLNLFARHPLVPTACLLVVGFGYATWAGLHQKAVNERLAEERLATQTDQVVELVLDRLQTYEYGLRGTRAAVVAIGERQLTHDAFLRYIESRKLSQYFPGARGFGFIHRVPRADDRAYLAQARRDVGDDFDIHTLGANDQDRYVIQYIEPIEHNRQAVGLDIASEANRKAAAAKAARHNVAALTAPITLVQAAGQTKRGMLFLLPLYHDGASLLTVRERTAAFWGWVYAPLIIDEVLGSVDTHEDELALTLEDVSDPQQPFEFYSRGDASAVDARSTQAQLLRPVYGRNWRFTAHALPAFYEHLNLRPPVKEWQWRALTTLLLSVLTYVYFAAMRRRERLQEEFKIDLERQVEQRTKELAEAIEESDLLLGMLNKHAIVSITDRAGRILEVNEGFCTISGYDRSELIGKNHRLVNSGTQPPEFWRTVWQRITNGQDWRGEICNRNKDGSLYWVDSIIAPLPSNTRRNKRYISIRTDVTAHKIAARELAKGRERLDNIIRGTNVGTWELNLITREALYNERWAEILGYSLSELGDLDIRAGLPFGHPDDIAPGLAELERHISGATEEFEYEWRSKHRDGSWRWVVDRGRVMTWTADGKAEWMFGTRQDITARREMEESLRKARVKAEAANAAKSQFLANMSHEIRTPLNAIIGLAFLLEESTLTSEQRSSLGKIQIAGRSLLGIINNILDLSKIEAGEMDLERAPFDLYELLGEVEKLVVAQTEKKGLKLLVDREPRDVPRFIVGDVTRLRQIFVNLLGNAVKFTADGSIELAVSVVDKSDDAVRLRCSVRDSGIGIATEVQSKLFSPFAQADTSTTRRFGGTGLGLSIVRQLAELMGGKIGLQSALGEGSEFWVELPFPIATSAVLSASDDKPLISLQGVRALVVDDSDVNLEVARRILEREGVVVTIKSDGQQAVDALRVGPSDFDVVLMDVQMPVMDGNTATQVIRTELELTQLPIIALTAGALITERQRTLEAGMNDFVTKPLNPKTLVGAVRRHVERTRLLPSGLVEGEAPHDSAAATARATGAIDIVDAQATNLSTQVDSCEGDGGEADWPEIPGIDGATVAELLGNDVELFMSLIGKLVQEYADLTTVALPDLTDTEQRRQLTARMHKLKGSSGTLGAGELYELAKATEMLLRGNSEALEIAARMQSIASVLAALTEAVRRAQSERQTEISAATTAPLRAEEWEELIVLLTQQNLAALDRFKVLSPGIAAQIQAAQFQLLKAAIEDLRFAEALTLLTDYRQRVSA